MANIFLSGDELAKQNDVDLLTKNQSDGVKPCYSPLSCMKEAVQYD